MRMYFAGHMALAYLANRALPKASFSLPLVFAAAMLPDMDFLFYQFFPHHTITHSLTFWSVLYGPVFAVFRRRAIPYDVVTFSHFIIGDLLTGNPPLLFGISDVRFGVLAPWLFALHGAAYATLYQAAIEAAMVALFLALSYRSLKSVWSGAHDSRHVLVLLAVVALVFFGALRGSCCGVKAATAGNALPCVRHCRRRAGCVPAAVHPALCVEKAAGKYLTAPLIV